MLAPVSQPPTKNPQRHLFLIIIFLIVAACSLAIVVPIIGVAILGKVTSCHTLQGAVNSLMPQQNDNYRAVYLDVACDNGFDSGNVWADAPLALTSKGTYDSREAFGAAVQKYVQSRGWEATGPLSAKFKEGRIILNVSIESYQPALAVLDVKDTNPSKSFPMPDAGFAAKTPPIQPLAPHDILRYSTQPLPDPSYAPGGAKWQVDPEFWDTLISKKTSPSYYLSTSQDRTLQIIYNKTPAAPLCSAAGPEATTCSLPAGTNSTHLQVYRLTDHGAPGATDAFYAVIQGQYVELDNTQNENFGKPLGTDEVLKIFEGLRILPAPAR